MSTRLDRLAAVAERLRRAVRAAPSVPPCASVAEYVALVRDQSYRVTDAHLGALRAAGLPDDAIFELTVQTAFAVADERLAAGLALLDGPPGP